MGRIFRPEQRARPRETVAADDAGDGVAVATLARAGGVRGKRGDRVDDLGLQIVVPRVRSCVGLAVRCRIRRVILPGSAGMCMFLVGGPSPRSSGSSSGVRSMHCSSPPTEQLRGLKLGIFAHRFGMLSNVVRVAVVSPDAAGYIICNLCAGGRNHRWILVLQRRRGVPPSSGGWRRKSRGRGSAGGLVDVGGRTAGVVHRGLRTGCTSCCSRPPASSRAVGGGLQHRVACTTVFTPRLPSVPFGVPVFDLVPLTLSRGHVRVDFEGQHEQVRDEAACLDVRQAEVLLRDVERELHRTPVQRVVLLQNADQVQRHPVHRRHVGRPRDDDAVEQLLLEEIRVPDGFLGNEVDGRAEARQFHVVQPVVPHRLFVNRAPQRRRLLRENEGVVEVAGGTQPKDHEFVRLLAAARLLLPLVLLVRTGRRGRAVLLLQIRRRCGVGTSLALQFSLRIRADCSPGAPKMWAPASRCALSFPKQFLLLRRVDLVLTPGKRGELFRQHARGVMVGIGRVHAMEVVYSRNHGARETRAHRVVLGERLLRPAALVMLDRVVAACGVIYGRQPLSL
mmetsp:Transcript_28176/g.71497  ORF Transcript_28176/g.71497 Transcript_28176/m.71497 type:complete len:564 (+) Transcript_28176:4118-5809(+)